MFYILDFDIIGKPLITGKYILNLALKSITYMLGKSHFSYKVCDNIAL